MPNLVAREYYTHFWQWSSFDDQVKIRPFENWHYSDFLIPQYENGMAARDAYWLVQMWSTTRCRDTCYPEFIFWVE